MRLFLIICAKSVMSYLLFLPCCLLINMSGGLNLSRSYTMVCLLPMLTLFGLVSVMCFRLFVRWRFGKSNCQRLLMSLAMLLSFVADLLFLFAVGCIVMAMCGREDLIATVE